MNYLFRAFFLLDCALRLALMAMLRFITRITDKITSALSPYISKHPDFEYVPSHLLLTGGLISTTNRAAYINKLAKIVAHAYAQQIDQVTLYLPYSLWHVRDALDLQNGLYTYLKELHYIPLISIISGDQTVELDEPTHDSFQNPNLMFPDSSDLDNKTAIVAILAPNAARSKLSASSLLVELLDERFFDIDLESELEKKPQTVDQFLKELPGYSSDVSGYFNRLVDCIINFGGDVINTVQGVPFWFLRKALVFNTINLANFEVNSLWRILDEYSHAKSKKKIILKDE